MGNISRDMRCRKHIQLGLFDHAKQSQVGRFLPCGWWEGTLSVDLSFSSLDEGMTDPARVPGWDVLCLWGQADGIHPSSSG